MGPTFLTQLFIGMAMIEAVVFDVSDTLTNAVEARTHAFDRIVRKFFPSLEGKGKEMMLLYWKVDMLHPNLSLRDIIEKTVEEFCRGNHLNCEDVDSLYQEYTEAVKEYECIRESFVEWILTVRGKYKLFILTSEGRDDVVSLLQKAGINPQEFDEIITRDELEKWDISKMSTQVYTKLCERHHLHPEECIMVGDSLIMDVLPAKAAGLKTVLLCWHADRVVNDFEGLGVNGF